MNFNVYHYFHANYNFNNCFERVCPVPREKSWNSRQVLWETGAARSLAAGTAFAGGAARRFAGARLLFFCLSYLFQGDRYGSMLVTIAVTTSVGGDGFPGSADEPPRRDLDPATHWLESPAGASRRHLIPDIRRWPFRWRWTPDRVAPASFSIAPGYTVAR
jgi:hypothetical protein